MQEKIQCYSYSRISTVGAQKRGHGIPRQLELSHAFAKEKGWIMNTDFSLIDVGKSAYHGRNLDDNAALGTFIQALDSGLIQKPAILLVESLDRLSRERIPKALQLFLTIINYGVSICTHFDGQIFSEERVQTDPSPLMLAICIMARAHEESATKARRKKESWKKARVRIKNGEIAHKGILPKWINIDKNKLSLDPDGARAIKDIFDCCINKNMSYADLHEYIEKNNYAPKIKKSCKKTGKVTISSHFIYRLFNDTQVLGIYEPTKVIEINGKRKKIKTGESIKAFPPVVSEDIYYQAQASIAQRLQRNSGRPSKAIPNFFRGLLRCDICQGAYRMKRSNGTGSYECLNKYRYKNQCQSSSYQSDKLQRCIFYAISHIDKDDVLEKSNQHKRHKIGKDIERLNAELKDKNSRADNLTELAESGSKKGNARLVQLEKDIDDIEEMIRSKKQELKFILSPSLGSNIDQVNSFHKKFSLDSAQKDDVFPINNSISKIVETIYIQKASDKSYKCSLKIQLHSGESLNITVHKDYSCTIYKGRKKIGFLDRKEAE